MGTLDGTRPISPQLALQNLTAVCHPFSFKSKWQPIPEFHPVIIKKVLKVENKK